MSKPAHLFAESLGELEALQEHLDVVLPILKASHKILESNVLSFVFKVYSDNTTVNYILGTSDDCLLDFEVRVRFVQQRREPLLYICVEARRKQSQDLSVDILGKQSKWFPITDVDEAAELTVSTLDEIIALLPK